MTPSLVFFLNIEYNPQTGFRAAYSKGIPQPFHDWFLKQGAFHPSPETAIGRLATTRELVNIPDVCSEEIFRRGDPLRNATVDLGGARSFAAIPMLAGERLIGAFTVYRQQVRPFDNGSLETARMFADQSVIAIENARLISEKRQRD